MRAIQSSVFDTLEMLGNKNKGQPLGTVPRNYELRFASDVSFELLYDLVFLYETNYLIANAATSENQKSWNRHDRVFAGNIWILININLANLDLAIHFGGYFFNDRMKGLTGSTPRSPKVHQYWNITL